MKDQNRIRVLHLDDEAADLDIFKEVIQKIPFFQYVASFSDAENCLQFIQSNENGFLIFSKLEMAGKNGLWLSEQLKGSNNALIFLTNQSTQAVQAQEESALHFIAPPITSEKLAACAEIIKNKKLVLDALFADQVQDYYEITESKSPPVRLLVYMADKIEVLTVSDIIYLTADASYTSFVLRDGQTVLSSKSIKTYEALLANHPDFLRIHKSNIINKQYLKTISRKQRTYKAIMINKHELEISYQRKDEIMEQILK